jgi:hypothetical protein
MYPLKYNKTDHKIKFMASIKLLHVWAPECHPQGVKQNKGTQVQHANSGTDRSHYHYQNLLLFNYNIIIMYIKF